MNNQKQVLFPWEVNQGGHSTTVSQTLFPVDADALAVAAGVRHIISTCMVATSSGERLGDRGNPRNHTNPVAWISGSHTDFQSTIIRSIMKSSLSKPRAPKGAGYITPGFAKLKGSTELTPSTCGITHSTQHLCPEVELCDDADLGAAFWIQKYHEAVDVCASWDGGVSVDRQGLRPTHSCVQGRQSCNHLVGFGCVRYSVCNICYEHALRCRWIRLFVTGDDNRKHLRQQCCQYLLGTFPPQLRL